MVCDGILIDITARRRAADELGAARDSAERLSRVDPLCGVYNRRHFGNGARPTSSSASRTVPRARRAAVLDIDHFKQLSTTGFGHQAGDRVLTAFAELIGGAVRPLRLHRALGRRGVRGPRSRTSTTTTPCASTPSGCGARSPTGRSPHGGELHAVTASIGAVRAAGDGWTPETLMDAADRALYAAKRRGRNQSLL